MQQLEGVEKDDGNKKAETANRARARDESVTRSPVKSARTRSAHLGRLVEICRRGRVSATYYLSGRRLSAVAPPLHQCGSPLQRVRVHSIPSSTWRSLELGSRIYTYDIFVSLVHPVRVSRNLVIRASRCSPSSFTSSINERPIPTEQPLIVSFRSSWLPFDVFVTGNTQLCPILVRCGTDAT